MRSCSKTYFLGVVLIVLVNIGCHHCEELCEFEKEYNTISRFFGGSGNNTACHLNTGGDPMVGAVAYNLFGGTGTPWSKTCGACVHVKGPDGEVTVKLVDGCGEGINLSKEAFNMIADPNSGFTYVTWNFVECPNLENKDIKYKFKAGSTSYWFGIQPNDHAYPVQKMELRKMGQFGDAWTNMVRDGNNFYQKPNEQVNPPFEIRMTSWTDELLYENKSFTTIPNSESVLIDGTVQFTKSSCSGSDVPPTTGPTTLQTTLTTTYIPDMCYVEDGLEYEATATYYSAAELAAQGYGSCEINTGGNMMVAAMAKSTYLTAQVCGQCVKVTTSTGNGEKEKSTVVKIIDMCSRSTCYDHDLELSLQAYAQIADPVVDSNVEIVWQIVECEVEGNINYRFRENSSKEWFKLQPMDHRVPIEKMFMEIESGSGWTEMGRDESNFFQKPTEYSSVKAPFRIQITGINGENLVDEISNYPGNVNPVAPGSVQFSSCNDSATTNHLAFSPVLLLIAAIFLLR